MQLGLTVIYKPMESSNNLSNQAELNVQFRLNPGATAAEIHLKPHQTITAEGGSMIAMSPNIQMSTSTHIKKSGGIIKGIKRMFSGENFFLNHFQGDEKGGTVWLGTTLSGDMLQKELNGETLIIQGGSYVASTEDIEIDLSWQGFKNLVSKENMFWIKAKGKGTVIFNSFGAIYPIQVQGEHIVDTGHIVAFEESLNFKISKAGGSWISSILGGEGLVCKFQGHGTVWVQSHNANAFGSIVGPKLKPRK